jgi:hypothetical protein
MSIPTPERLKKKAILIRSFLKEKCDAVISHSQSLELISKVFDFKDWNTAAAMSKSKVKQNSTPSQIKTVGEMRKALEPFEDSAMIDASYEFKLKEIEIDPLVDDPEDATIYQEFSYSLEDCASEDIASFKLKLEYETISGS